MKNMERLHNKKGGVEICSEIHLTIRSIFGMINKR